MDYTSALSPFMRQTLQRNAEGEVEAPKNIIKTLSAAYNQYSNVRQAHIERIRTYAAIDGLLGGNTPYSQEELEAAGLGHLANFNNFKARSSYEKAAGGFWNLLNSVDVFVKISLVNSIPQSTKFAAIMSRHFSDVLKEWEDFSPNFNLLGSQLVRYGLSPIVFPDETSPAWEVVDVSKFYIPSDTSVFVSKLSNVCIETVYTVQDLYQIYESKASEEGPWNKAALGDYLILRANALTEDSQFPVADAKTWQEFINTNSSIVNQYFTDTVRLVNMYQKEYDGKISHYIFSTDIFNQSNWTQESTFDFLYFVDRQYDSIEEAILVFTGSPGEWLVHSNLGLGQKMYAASQAINMLDCSIVDMARMSSTPLIRSMATGGRSADPIRFYPGVPTDIGTAEFVQNQLGANIDQLVGASMYLSNAIEVNTMNSGDDPGVPDRSQGSISPSEARARSFKEFGVLKNVVAHFYNTLDKLIRTTFIRFLNIKEGSKGWELAKEFKQRCLEDGVPEELFDTARKGLHGLPRQFRAVRAARVAGDGSTLARIMGLEAMQVITPTFNPVEMDAWKREWVTATMGVDYVETFASETAGDEISGGASLAKVEDGLMMLGREALFSPDNDQAAHIDEHMATASGIVRSVAEQQMSPVDADKVMRLLIPHLSQHLEFIAKSPMFYAQVFRKVQDPFRQLMSWAQLNRRNAQAMVAAAMRKQQEDEAATQEVMTDAQRKDFIAQRDAERADFKVQKQVERAQDANRNRAEIMREKVYEDANVQKLKVEREAEVKRMATAKGRTQEELLNTPLEDLRGQVNEMIGSTPSTVDFE